MSIERSTIKQLSQHRFTFLLAALILVLVVAPLAEQAFLGAIVFTVGITAVFIGGLMANRGRKRVFRTGLVVAACAIPIAWATLFTRSSTLDLIEYLFIILFCGVAAAMILISVMREHIATPQAIVGAICVYLLIGLTWAMVYSAIEYAEDDPFSFQQNHRMAVKGVQNTAFSQLVYFSFVTMSTLGYGDITPRTVLAEVACWMQSIVGQLYIAILIARLVSELRLTRPEERTG